VTSAALRGALRPVHSHLHASVLGPLPPMTQALTLGPLAITPRNNLRTVACIARSRNAPPKCFAVGVAHQHPRVAMTTDRCNLRHGKALLEKPTDGLVAKVVKPKAGNASPPF